MANREYKITTIGDSGVGKTSIINRIYFGTFNEMASPTIGVAYVKTNVQLTSGSVTLNLWDTAGQERFSNLQPIYLRGSNLVLIVFDLTASNSLDIVKKLKSTVDQSIPSEVPIFVVGNKLDMAPSSGMDVYSWCSVNNLKYFTVSARTGQNIDDLLQEIATIAHNSSNVVNRALEIDERRRESEENSSKCC